MTPTHPAIGQSTHRRVAAAIAIATSMLLAACAPVPSDPEARSAYDRANDPAEPANRAIFALNHWVDRNALQPVARTYDSYVPDGVRTSARNFALNLREPIGLVNHALQGNLDRAWITTQRFAINSTIGGAGLFDVATDRDLPFQEADFGQTLGVWGIEPGPSVQLPLLGPSNLRDSVGTVVGIVANPLGFIPGGTMQAIQLAGTGVGIVDGRARMLPATDDLERNALDYYAALRSMSAQRRAALVEKGRTGAPPGRVDVGPTTPPR